MWYHSIAFSLNLHGSLAFKAAGRAEIEQVFYDRLVEILSKTRESLIQKFQEPT